MLRHLGYFLVGDTDLEDQSMKITTLKVSIQSSVHTMDQLFMVAVRIRDL